METIIANGNVYNSAFGSFAAPEQAEAQRFDTHEAVQAAFVLVALFVFYTV